MKQEVDPLIRKYGTENPPPPSRYFTIANGPGHGNFHMVQKVFQGAFEFDILLSSGSAGQPLTSDVLSKEIKTTAQAFEDKFKEIYSPMKPFDSPKYLPFSKAMLSNLVGGIGYFYGDSIVDRSNAPEYDEEDEGFWEGTAEARARAKLLPSDPAELFTSIPSRPILPSRVPLG
ncbi:glucosidase I [Coccidioides immitis H538.4]|uniref:Mannosyl-oligosaccharide glucosidase n=1 Tax=Coccidioides immitis H538.4 TaxID=396776 RepID=A0A0J8S3D1_COCIT|nr:glucosidase I [Coccidioides immitis H538.4]